MTIATNPMTTEEMLALPENPEVVPELFSGELRQREMTRRNYGHSRIESNLSYFLLAWSRSQKMPRGAVVGGEAAICVSRNPDVSFGVDVAYIGPGVAHRIDKNARFVDGVPRLVIEILSPSDVHELVSDKVDLYLAAGVPHVWVVDPANRPGQPPESFNVTHTITAEPDLPGFRLAVADIFAV